MTSSDYWKEQERKADRFMIMVIAVTVICFLVVGLCERFFR